MEYLKKELRKLSKNQLIAFIFELLPLKLRVEELERRLLAYENAHTPLPAKAKRSDRRNLLLAHLVHAKGIPNGKDASRIQLAL